MKVQISTVIGNSQRLDGGAMFGNAPRVMWEKWITPDELGRIPLACRCLLIEWNNKVILCETGIGAFFEPKLADRFGVQDAGEHRLLQSLKDLGFSHEDIDYVILSHLHFDHAGGLLPSYSEIQSAGFQLLFPNAQYVVGKQAFTRAKNPHFRDKASFIPELQGLLETSGRLYLVEDLNPPEELKPLVSFIESSGHTPGQMHTLIHGEDHPVLFCGDLVPGTQWVHLPITMGYDRYPEMLIEEKQELYQKAIDENWLLFYTHDSEYSGSFLELSEKNRYQPKTPQKHYTRREV